MRSRSPEPAEVRFGEIAGAPPWVATPALISHEAAEGLTTPAPEGDKPREPNPQDVRKHFLKLTAARRRVEQLAHIVRDLAFDDWVRRCTAISEEPSEWTGARVLYQSYVRWARNYGETRRARAESRVEIATETQWGRMMAIFPKKRRGRGYFYPLRLKLGA
jgi:hypothetical protein